MNYGKTEAAGVHLIVWKCSDVEPAGGDEGAYVGVALKACDAGIRWRVSRG